MNDYPWLQPLTEGFADRLAGGQLPHALLISGPAGTGKAELASALLTSMLCLEQRWPACGDCQSCRWLSSGAHPDFQYVSFEPNPRTGRMRKEIIVDQVRALSSSLQLTATVSPRKGAIITPADAMNINAANALLKTLEEPQGDTILILVTDNPARLPATIRSRCQSMDVRLSSVAAAMEWLENDCQVSSQEARVALQAAAGSPLQARRMIEDGSSGEFASLAASLNRLAEQNEAPEALMAQCLEMDGRQLWSWLSLHAASKMRTVDLASGQAAILSRLQTRADRNRALMSSQVRNDLLLRDWLIQWSELRL